MYVNNGYDMVKNDSYVDYDMDEDLFIKWFYCEFVFIFNYLKLIYRYNFFEYYRIYVIILCFLYFVVKYKVIVNNIFILVKLIYNLLMYMWCIIIGKFYLYLRL